MADLISLSCYKEYKDINNPSRDGKIQALITRASKLIEHYCNRSFVEYSVNPKTEWHDGKTNVVELLEFPIINVVSVKTSDDGGITQTALTKDSASKDGYFVDLENGRIISQQSQNNFIDEYDVPYRSLEVEYTAGYLEDELPADLELAVLDLVHYYESEESTPSKSLLGGTINTAQPYLANSFPPAIRRVLDLYRYSPS
jgi:hypothetical protein